MVYVEGKYGGTFLKLQDIVDAGGVEVDGRSIQVNSSPYTGREAADVLDSAKSEGKSIIVWTPSFSAWWAYNREIGYSQSFLRLDNAINWVLGFHTEYLAREVKLPYNKSVESDDTKKEGVKTVEIHIDVQSVIESAKRGTSIHGIIEEIISDDIESEVTSILENELDDMKDSLRHAIDNDNWSDAESLVNDCANIASALA